MHCERFTKGRVIFTSLENKKETIEITQTPFSVTCGTEEIIGCGKKGTWIREWTAARGGVCNGSDEVEGYEFEQFTFRAIPMEGAYDGNRYDLVKRCGSREVVEGFSIGCGSVTFTSLKFVPSQVQSILRVFNKTGKQIAEVKVKNCEYEIACGDECPPHHVKCKSNHYPGYCCISCKKTANKINNLANKIK